MLLRLPKVSWRQLSTGIWEFKWGFYFIFCLLNGNIIMEYISAPCDEMSCLNDGTCVRTAESEFECSCPYGFYGRHCELIYSDHCASKPCKNGAACTNLGYDYHCECTNQYHGITCDSRYETLDPCKKYPCQNGDTCRRYSESEFTCLCAHDFTGTLCEIEWSLFFIFY